MAFEGREEFLEAQGDVYLGVMNGLHRLEGELGGKGGILEGGEDRTVAPGGAVLGERPSRLSHEPHRRAVHRLSAAGPHQVGHGVCREAHPSGSMTTAVP